MAPSSYQPSSESTSIMKKSIPDVDEVFDEDFIQQILSKEVTWGKHKGKTYEYLLNEETDYFIWAANTHLTNLGYTKTFGVMKQLILKTRDTIEMDIPLLYGKYKGKKISDIYKEDGNYIKWLYKKRNEDRHLSMDTRVMRHLLKTPAL
jgi:uncharacterized protein (DUF3820 family)